MTAPEMVELTPAQASAFIREELDRAAEALSAARLDTALDRYARALGLALQLGPAPAEQVLAAVLGAAHELARQGEADGLSALGPALVGLAHQVREAGGLPATQVMEAWATIAADLGALIGQLGLAFSLPPDRRGGMLDRARTRAALLDSATGQLFDLTAWLESLHPPPLDRSALLP